MSWTQFAMVDVPGMALQFKGNDRKFLENYIYWSERRKI